MVVWSRVARCDEAVHSCGCLMGPLHYRWGFDTFLRFILKSVAAFIKECDFLSGTGLAKLTFAHGGIFFHEGRGPFRFIMFNRGWPSQVAREPANSFLELQ